MTALEYIKANPIVFIANLLVIVGALNWLSIGLLKTDYVTTFLGENAKWIFIIVGLAGVYLAYRFITSNYNVEHMISNTTSTQCTTGTPGCTPMYT